MFDDDATDVAFFNQLLNLLHELIALDPYRFPPRVFGHGMTPQTSAANIRRHQLSGGSDFDLRGNWNRRQAIRAVFHPAAPFVLLDDASRDRQDEPQPSAFPGRCYAGPARSIASI